MLLTRKLPITLSPVFWQGNLNKQDCHNLPVGIFLKEIIQAWNSIDLSVPQSHCEILSPTIFNNRFIRVDQNTVYHIPWIVQGVRYIKDLVKNDGHFLTVNEFNVKYNMNVNFLNYASVVSAIPASWKRVIHDSGPDCECEAVRSNYVDLLKAKKACNFVYMKLIPQVFKPPRRVQRQWHDNLGVEWDDNVWKKVYDSNRKAILGSKFRAFSYHYLHRTLVFNNLLHKIGKVDSNLCTFCGEAEENFVHLFMNCRVTETCFNDLQQWLLTNNVSITKEQTVIDYHCESELEFFHMKIGILFRHFLYCCRCKIEPPNINKFIYQIKALKEIEENIARRNNKLEFHNKVWSYLPIQP